MSDPTTAVAHPEIVEQTDANSTICINCFNIAPLRSCRCADRPARNFTNPLVIQQAGLQANPHIRL
ncbi:MAG TPA: hypothetical protein DCO73_03200 [Alphaproteobacteria bacterium]|nr:hypothetical protein [Alphaproteobacteria bacterium]